MRTIIEKSALLKALNHVQSVVERRNTIPILSNVLLQAKGGMLALTATDLEIEIREKIEAEVMQDGAITAPAHMLYDIVRKLPDGAQVELALDEMPVAFALPGSSLHALIDRTKFAISSEETRYYLNGIFLHTVEAGDRALLRAVATDGHRLAQAQIVQPVGAAGMPSIIVPRKTVNEIQKLLEESAGEVSIQLSDTRINFAFENIVLTSKLIDGKFPDYSRVIPVDNDKQLSVDVKSFSQSVDRVAAISSEKSRAVKLMLGSDKLTFSVSNPDGGSATDEVAVAYDASPLEIGFNARYLLDIMSQIEGETASFELADAGSPTIVRDLADADALYVLMPMRV